MQLPAYMLPIINLNICLKSEILCWHSQSALAIAAIRNIQFQSGCSIAVHTPFFSA